MLTVHVYDVKSVDSIDTVDVTPCKSLKIFCRSTGILTLKFFPVLSIHLLPFLPLEEFPLL